MNEPIPAAGGPPTQPGNSKLAIWSLVLGILGLLCCTIFAAIPGVICGHKALTRIKQSNGSLEGRGLAIAGLVISYIAIAWAIVFLPMIAIPNFIKARETAQANLCINNLGLIDSAKHQWAIEHHKSGADTPTMDDLKQYLPASNPAAFVCPAAGTYTIGPVDEKPKCSNPKHALP